MEPYVCILLALVSYCLGKAGFDRRDQQERVPFLHSTVSRIRARIDVFRYRINSGNPTLSDLN